MKRIIWQTAAMLVACGGLVLAAATARAQTYPDKPIRLMHGFAPGGNADTVARVLGTALSGRLGQPVVVDGKPGAGGTLAGDAVAKSRADGYTLLLATGGHAIGAALQDKLPYDAVKSFQPISTVTSFPFLIVTGAASKYQTLHDLLAAARAKPGGINYGTAGIGTGQHMTGALLAKSAGLTMTHVPYRGESAAITGLLGGEIDFVVAAPTAVVQHVKAGKLRALATSGSLRWSGLPAVGTVAEQGVPAFEVRSWTALLAPAGTPLAVVERLNTQVHAVLDDAAVRAKLEEATGGEARACTPEELRAAIESDVQRWVRLVRDAGIQKE
jgi:tripartite-type tricarboxylate transporter receptor subunit TctC